MQADAFGLSCALLNAYKLMLLEHLQSSKVFYKSDPSCGLCSVNNSKQQCSNAAGFGLDFVWPYLAEYPEDKVGVIDDTCVMRPTHILGPSPLAKVSPLPYRRPSWLICSLNASLCPCIRRLLAVAKSACCDRQCVSSFRHVASSPHMRICQQCTFKPALKEA